MLGIKERDFGMSGPVSEHCRFLGPGLIEEWPSTARRELNQVGEGLT